MKSPFLHAETRLNFSNKSLEWNMFINLKHHALWWLGNEFHMYEQALPH